MNEERMKKLLISKRVNAKIEHNKEKHNALRVKLNNQQSDKATVEKHKTIVSIDSD